MTGEDEQLSQSGQEVSESEPVDTDRFPHILSTRGNRSSPGMEQSTFAYMKRIVLTLS